MEWRSAAENSRQERCGELAGLSEEKGEGTHNSSGGGGRGVSELTGGRWEAVPQLRPAVPMRDPGEESNSGASG